MRNLPRHLVIFVKAPRAGQAKTRLAKTLGRVRAARFARRLAAHTIRQLGRDRRWRTVLAVTPDRFTVRGRWWPLDLPRMPQGGGDLGARMARPFINLSKGPVVPKGPVVIVGSDIPGMNAHLIEAAFRALGGHDMVVGPAADGGYWLIGFARRRPLGGTFKHVRWSTPHALADTLASVPSVQKVAMLPTLSDVDEPGDLDGDDLPVSTF